MGSNAQSCLSRSAASAGARRSETLCKAESSRNRQAAPSLTPPVSQQLPAHLTNLPAFKYWLGTTIDSHIHHRDRKFVSANGVVWSHEEAENGMIPRAVGGCREDVTWANNVRIPFPLSFCVVGVFDDFGLCKALECCQRRRSLESRILTLAFRPSE